ncbi:hypothetical protein KAR91_04815 [Candidatus Pacearchaeota archaeon]|nr:hypothetical protein [Candidatus Pacearchaeota archaeon]
MTLNTGPWCEHIQITGGDYFIQPTTWICQTCYSNPCQCCITQTSGSTWITPPDFSGIEEKLDKIIKLLEPEGLEEYKKEIRDEIHKELLSESLEKFKELWESLAEK